MIQKIKLILIGLLLADGCISTGNSIRISLIDKQIIDDIYSVFPFLNYGIFDYSKYNSKSKRQYSLSIKSKNLQLHLKDHGMLPIKSTVNSMFLKLPILENRELYKDCIRGYFDGNGSISIPSARPNLRRVEICSSSKTLIEDIKSIFLEFKIPVPICRTKRNKNTDLYLLEWVKTSDILILKEFLYPTSADMKLNRKFEKFNFSVVDKTLLNPLCPFCSSASIRDGTRTTKLKISYRYICKSCNKHFQILAQIKEDELLETPKDKVTTT